MNNKKILYLTQGALIAAIYIMLTLLFQPISFGEVQVRISEILTILPFFTPAAIPGLFVGCLLGNFLGGAAPWDIIIGSGATLLAAIMTYMLRNKSMLFAPIPPITVNAVVVGLMLRYIYNLPLQIWMLILSVGIGQFISAGVLGIIFGKVCQKYKNVLFK